MLVRNAFPNDFLEIANKSKEWADLVIERESIYHIMVEHFKNTCFIAEDRGQMIGYLIGFRSQSHPEVAIHTLNRGRPASQGQRRRPKAFQPVHDIGQSHGLHKHHRSRQAGKQVLLGVLYCNGI